MTETINIEGRMDSIEIRCTNFKLCHGREEHCKFIGNLLKILKKMGSTPEVRCQSIAEKVVVWTEETDVKP